MARVAAARDRGVGNVDADELPRWYRWFVIGTTVAAAVLGAVGYTLARHDIDPVLAALAYLIIPVIIAVAVTASLNGWPRLILLVSALLDVEALLAAQRFAIGLAFSILLPLIGLVLVIGLVRGRAMVASFVLSGVSCVAAMVVALTVGPASKFAIDSNPLPAVLAAALFVTFSLVHVAMIMDRRTRAIEEARAEIASRRAAETERDTTSRLLSTIVDSSPVSTQAFRSDGTVVLWNPASERIFGWSAEEVVGHPYPQGMSAGDAAFAERIRRTLAGDVIKGDRVLRHTKDGREVWVDIYAARMVGEDGEAVGVAGQMVDVTERIAIDERLRQGAKMEAIGQLAGGVAHDFNNLLTAIRGYTELARAGLDPSQAAVGADLDEIASAAERATELTRQLLAFARKAVLEPRVVDPAAAIARFAPMLRRLIGESIGLELDLGEDVGRVRVDPSQLDQIVLNLAVNARDAMPGGGTLRIGVRNVDVDRPTEPAHPGPLAGPHIELSVADTGVGMDAATRARIFEPFFTTKDPGRGTGMGLATVFGIVTMSDGMVTVDSEPGKGTRFRICLPRVDAAIDEADEPAAATADGGGETVLLVEDESMVRAFASRVLSNLGYRVLQAGRAEEAIAIAEAQSGVVDVVVTDVVLPGMQGPELAAQLATRWPGLGVLLCSGYSETPLGEVPGLGRPRYLAKPYTSDALAREVRRTLDDLHPGV